MSMTRRKPMVSDGIPYAVANGKIVCAYELQFGRHLIQPGDKVKIKNQRGTYTFYRLAHNIESGSSWIDCRNPQTGEFHSFHIAKIRSVIRPKKLRGKKDVV
jgi:hypothetical protein